MSENENELEILGGVNEGGLNEGDSVTTPEGDSGTIESIQEDPVDPERRIVSVKVIGEDGTEQNMEYSEEDLLAA